MMWSTILLPETVATWIIIAFGRRSLLDRQYIQCIYKYDIYNIYLKRYLLNCIGPGGNKNNGVLKEVFFNDVVYPSPRNSDHLDYDYLWQEIPIVPLVRIQHGMIRLY